MSTTLAQRCSRALVRPAASKQRQAFSSVTQTRSDPRAKPWILPTATVSVGGTVSPTKQSAAAAAGKETDALDWGKLQSTISPTGRLASLDTDARVAAKMGPVPLYNHYIANGMLEMNCGQGMIVYRLSALFEAMVRQDCCSTQKGIYIHGSVGCGKTMAMDIFAASVHAALPHLKVFRTHLNRFLETVHTALKQVPSLTREFQAAATASSGCRFVMHNETIQKPFNMGRSDERGVRRTGSAAGWTHVTKTQSLPTSLELVAKLLAETVDVLCLDEVSITNLQNCVLLGPLIHALCNEGVVVVATSNKDPQDLYEQGLDRDLHLPQLTQAINSRCDVLRLSSDIDYRKQLCTAKGQHQVFKWQCEDVDSRTFMDAWWAALSGTAKLSSVPVGYGRLLPVLQSRDEQCARFAFADLCTCPPVALGSADYVELCSRYHTVLVSDVPRLRSDAADAARRWTLFLDSCYESHVRLIMSSSAEKPEDLLDLTEPAGDDGGQSLQEASYAVTRCSSRLYEMQSQLYQDSFTSRHA